MASPRPVALAGFMGVGKTTAGRLAATALGRPFLDTDREVEAEAGLPVAEIFRTEGERRFRELEAAAVTRALDAGLGVIALGGGALLDPGSRRSLLERSLLIHIDVPWAELQPALAAMAASRPLLAGRDGPSLEALFRERQSLYACAPLRVAAHRDGAAAVAEAIVRAVRQWEAGQPGTGDARSPWNSP